MLYAANKNRRQRGPLAIVLGLWGITGAWAAFGAAAETPGEAPSNRVSIYLNVEKDGKLISGLERGNFRLSEDGRSRNFRLEAPEEPAAIALLVEHSAASGYFLEDIQYAVDGLRAHGIEGHWYALATYAKKLEIQTDFTKLKGEISQAYSQLGVPAWNEINSYDAVYEMVDKMDRLPGRRILIVIGSGVDTFSEHSLEDVKKKIEESNVTVFAAGIGSMMRGSYDPYLSSSGRMQLAQAQAFLQMLASKSGGFAWFPNMSNVFHDAVEGMMQSVATQYRIVYDSQIKGAGKFRKIKVEAFRVVDDKRESFKVLAREGWR